MDKDFELLSRKGATATEIADFIRAQIRSSRYVPGQRLVEVDIIRQTGGSRFKVREALQRLAAEGLVEIDGQSIQVTGLGWYFVRGIAMVFDRYVHADQTRAKFSRII